LVFGDEQPFNMALEGLERRCPFGIRNLKTSMATFQVLAKANTTLLRLSKAATSLTKMSVLSGYRGRYFTLSQNPTVLADAGHNADAWKILGSEIGDQTDGQLHVVCGFVKGKNPAPFFTSFPKETNFYLGDMSIPRNRPVDETQAMLDLSLQLSAHKSIASAFEAAKAKAKEDDLIFVGGSTFVVGELFEHLNLG